MIYLGSDHRGFWLKEKIRLWLEQWRLPFRDLSPKLQPGDDYPQIARRVAEKVKQHPEAAVGILLCGSGLGVSIVANKIQGVRAGLGFSSQQIRAGRRDDDLNLLCLAADFTSRQRAKKIIRAFLETEFSQEKRRQRRLKEIKQIEEEQCQSHS